MAIATRNEGRKVTSDINVTPMVDVMLVLLIIFMVITPLIEHNVDLAKTNNPIAMPDADKEDSLVVAVTHDGRVYLGSNLITLDELTAKLKDKLDRKIDQRVFVKADAHAKYGVIVNVVDNIRSANVENLGLLTQQNRPVAPPPPPPGTLKKIELTT